MDVKFLIEEGFFDLLGVVAELRPATSCCADADVAARYDLWRVHGLAVEFVLMTPKDGRCNPSVGHIFRDILKVREFCTNPVAFGSVSMCAIKRLRLVRLRVPFVVLGRQIYLPFLGFALREEGSSRTCEALGTISQRLLSAALTGELRGSISELDAIRIGRCSRASAFRAFHELESFGLLRRCKFGNVFVASLANALAERQPRLKKSDVRDYLVKNILAFHGELI